MGDVTHDQGGTMPVLVEVVGEANHHVWNERALGVSRRERHIRLQSLIEVTRLLVALRQFVLGIGDQVVILVLPQDEVIRFDRLVPLVHFLGELPE